MILHFDSGAEAADYMKKHVRFFRLGFMMRRMLRVRIDTAERAELLEYAEHLSKTEETE